MARLSQLRRLIQQTFFPGTVIRRKYEAFRALLECDRVCHQRMARLEELYYTGKQADFFSIHRHYERLSRALGGMVEQLLEMNPQGYAQLPAILTRIDRSIRRSVLTDPEPDTSPPFVLPLDDPLSTQALRVGGKAATLALISRSFPINVPRGFAVTTSAFHRFLSHNALGPRIEKVLSRLDVLSAGSLEDSSSVLEDLILEAVMPADLQEALLGALEAAFPGGGQALAVRSSCVGEDSQLSFAGQYKTLLRVCASDLQDAYRHVLASKYSPEALVYRIGHGLLESGTPMAVLVLEMIDALSSGVLYTEDPLSREPGTMALYCVKGKGEHLVSGAVTPERLVYSKEAAGAVLKRVERSDAAAAKEGERASGGGPAGLGFGEETDLPVDLSTAAQVASWGMSLEAFFQGPQDMEWCVDRAGRVFLLQCRPLLRLEQTRPDASGALGGNLSGGHPHPRARSSTGEGGGFRGEILLSGGETASPGKAWGTVRNVSASRGTMDIPEGSILVVDASSPALARLMPRARAVIARVGSVAGHLASVARERGVPMLVNVEHALEKLPEGIEITVDADERKIYAGITEAVLREAEGHAASDDTPFRSRLKALLGHVSSLHLTDPQSPQFQPENCQTLHDVLRFTHEKAVEEMFFLAGEGAGRVRGARKLASEVPISLYVLDLDGGLDEGAGDAGTVELHHVTCEPVKHLWNGLTGPGVDWSSDRRHVDWEEFDRISGGIFSLDSPLLSSFALVSREYVNVNIRFGYHFVLLDAFCGGDPRENYVTLQFEGGGGGYRGRQLRIQFLKRILMHHGFEVRSHGDLLHAGLRHLPRAALLEKMEMMGRLLGVTRLMDIRLDDEQQVEQLAVSFLSDWSSRPGGRS